MPVFNIADLVRIFNQCFEHTENTILKAGGEEPIYLPAEQNSPAVIVATQDYFSSALHEVSHWCIAGRKRREQVDYGYWYEPDGRTEMQQQAFEQVEIKPQALEWVLSSACDKPFRISADNLDNPEIIVSDTFKQNVVAQAKRYIQEELNGRALVFYRALAQFYKPPCKIGREDYFSLDKL